MNTQPLKPPKNLPEHLAAIWRETAPQVRPAIGAAGLEALCIQIARQRDAQRRITEEGLVVADGKGNPAPHPALEIERAAQREIRDWLKQFATRTR